MATREAPYTIQSIDGADTEEALAFLKRTFFVHEPVNQGVNLCADENEECLELEDYCLSSMHSGFSLKAVDKEGNIVGITISAIVDLKKDGNGNSLQSQAERCKNPKFQRILHLLAIREQNVKLCEKFPDAEKLLEIKAAATDPAWGRKGIMTNLLKETESLAKKHNIHLIRMDTSSAYSAIAADKCGYTCVSRMLYKDIKLNGQVLTSPPHPHVEDRVNVKII